jgi:hypothetical protein
MSLFPSSFNRPLTRKSAQIPESTGVGPIHAMFLPHTVAETDHDARDRSSDRGNA